MNRDLQEESGVSSVEPTPTLTAEPSEGALLAAYAEVCRSYHAIDDFRMKLLGLLPFASLAGLVLLQAGDHLAQPTLSSREIVGFSSIFALALTLALFSYEIRGIRRCHNLIQEGAHLENQLGIGHGQFHLCTQEHDDPHGIRNVANSKLSACFIYSLVFAGWLFIALRFGFGIETRTCSGWAVFGAVALGSLTYLGVRKWTAA